MIATVMATVAVVEAVMVATAVAVATDRSKRGPSSGPFCFCDIDHAYGGRKRLRMWPMSNRTTPMFLIS